MLEYDNFQSEVAAMTKPPGEVLLLPNQLLKKWMDEVNIPYKPVLFKGLQVLSFSREDIDYLCEWIDRSETSSLIVTSVLIADLTSLISLLITADLSLTHHLSFYQHCLSLHYHP